MTKLSIIVAVIPVVAFAQSLKEKTERAREDEIFQAEIKELNTSCDTKIKGTWDWDSFAGKLQHGGSHVASNCGVEVDMIANMCKSDKTGEVKPAIKKGIAEVRCKGGGGKDGSVELKGKTVILSTSLEQEKQLQIKDYIASHI
jgi:hypothetical protein